MSSPAPVGVSAVRAFFVGTVFGAALVALLGVWLLATMWRASTAELHAIEDAVAAERARVEILLAVTERARQNYGLADDHLAAATDALSALNAPTQTHLEVRDAVAMARQDGDTSDLKGLQGRLVADEDTAGR